MPTRKDKKSKEETPAPQAEGTTVSSIEAIASSRENAAEYMNEVVEYNEELRSLPVTKNSFRSVRSISASEPAEVVEDPRKNRIPEVAPENKMPTLAVSSWNAARAAGVARRAAQKPTPKTTDDIQVTRTTRDKLGRNKKK